MSSLSILTISSEVITVYYYILQMKIFRGRGTKVDDIMDDTLGIENSGRIRSKIEACVKTVSLSANTSGLFPP